MHDGPRPPRLHLLLGPLTGLPARALFRMRWTGLGNVPGTGGFVLAANHTSNLDPWAIGLPLYRTHSLRFMAKSELYWFPLGPVLTVAGAFPVRRGERDVEAFTTAVRLCREGHVVVMFPEGTRRKKGMRKRHRPRPHTGAARIALEAGVPLVPAAISGIDRLSRFGPVRVAYGAPVGLDDLREGDPLQAAQEATERLMEAIAGLEQSA